MGGPGRIFLALAAAVFGLAATARSAAAVELDPGDIVVTSYTGGGGGDAVIKVDPETGDQTYISTNQMSVNDLLSTPQGVVVDDDGSLLVVNHTGASVIRIDPATGEQTLVSNNTSPGPVAANFQNSAALTVDDAGQILVANNTSVISVDPETGTRSLVSSGGLLTAGHAIALEASGMILVSNIDANNDVVRVNPANGQQSVVSNTVVTPPGQALDLLVADDGDILVADINSVQGPPLNDQSGAIYRVDPLTGTGPALSNNTINTGVDLFQDPAAVALDAQDRVIVTDYGTDRVIRVNPATGQQTLVSDASTSSPAILVDAYGVAVVGPAGPLLTCKGREATISGSAAGETLTGTGGGDVIAALGGGDKVNGGGGNDVICGGGGGDDLRGQGGRDKLYGESGRDELTGGAGRGDLCDGGPGNDAARRSCEQKKSI
jgi:sugar lactone lactonase YvrE